MSSPVRLIGLLVLALACAPTADKSMTDTERAAVRDTIEAELQQLIAAASEVDADRVATFLSPSPDFAAASEGELAVNRDSVIAGVHRAYAGLQAQPIHFRETAIAVLSRDIVVTSQKGTFSVTDTMGKVSPNRVVVWTTVWHRVGADWKAVVLHQSFGAPDTARAGR